MNRSINATTRIGRTFSFIPVPDTWHNIVYCWGADSVFTYLDGVLQNRSADAGWSFIEDTSTIRIGYTEGTNGISGCWKGFLDDIRIYNRKLTRSEVGTLYNNQIGLNSFLGEKKSPVIYPNPNSGKQFFIKNGKLSKWKNTLYVYNSMGEHIKQIIVSEDAFTVDLPLGMYIFKIVMDNDSKSTIIEKIIIN